MASKQSAAAPPRPLGVCEKLFNALSLTAAFRPLRRIPRRPHPLPPPAGDSPAKKKEPPLTVRTVEVTTGTPSPPPMAGPKPLPSPATAPPSVGGGPGGATEKRAVFEMGLERGKAQQSKIGPDTGNGPKSVASPSIPGPGLASNDHKIGKERRGLVKAKSDINERVEEFIKRTKMKFRIPTGIVGKPST